MFLKPYLAGGANEREGAEMTEHNGFKINVREEAGRWIATITKIDGSMLLADLPHGTGPRSSLDTDPPTYSRDAAIQLAVDAINGGQIK
jgi:hypothetical protein